MHERDLLDAIIDNICELQGREHALATMLEAIVISHPNPAKLRDAWLALSAPRIAQAATTSAINQKDAAAATAHHLQRWGETLLRHHPT